MAHDEKILAGSKKHPLAPSPNGQPFQYGTAGFRMSAHLLDGVTFRVGLLASLRSRKRTSYTIGLMITASHNPPVDNGVKVVDPMGEMLEQDWERYATDLVNSPSDEELVRYYNLLAHELKIDLSVPAKAIIGRDTRPSGPGLAAAALDALDATNTDSVDYKLLTTPQLHYLVRATNSDGTPTSYGKVSEEGYYEKLADAFLRAVKGKKINGPLSVDCANGVGGPKLTDFLKHLAGKVDFDVRIINDDVLRPEVLNLDCGADYVKTKQRAPPSPKLPPGLRSCSFDGDVDRLMYYWVDPESGFFMLDGDRISSLAASFLRELLDKAALADTLTMGVVQTAYANGASTNYITQHLKMKVTCTPTGVKHLHHVAQGFDVGVYFEANGHGTVLFSLDAQQAFRQTKPQSPAQKEALEILSALSNLINQTVGDAISDMLLVEAILAHKNWTLRDWAMTYTDLPNKLVRIEVADKNMFETTDAERRLVKPEGAQKEIDQLVKKYKDARAFARASGTENAVRVYAEAATLSEVAELAKAVARVVEEYGRPGASSR